MAMKSLWQAMASTRSFAGSMSWSQRTRRRLGVLRAPVAVERADDLDLRARRRQRLAETGVARLRPTTW
jgi:hypothetical protein